MCANDDGFFHFSEILDELVFLPLHKIDDGMNYLKTIVPSNANELFKYFGFNYVTITVYGKSWFNKCLKLRRIKMTHLQRYEKCMKQH